MGIYCTYLITYKGNKLPPFYIGSSNINRLEAGYRGSVSSIRYGKIWKQELKENPHLFKYHIITTHDTRKEATEKELQIQMRLKVMHNPMYINESYARINGVHGLSLSGKNHWSKQPGKIHNAKINHPRGMLGKNHSDDFCKFISEIQMGEKNHFYGKKHSPDALEKMRIAASNTIWITNGIDSSRHPKDAAIPEGWFRGRCLKKRIDQ